MLLWSTAIFILVKAVLEPFCFLYLFDDGLLVQVSRICCFLILCIGVAFPVATVVPLGFLAH